MSNDPLPIPEAMYPCGFSLCAENLNWPPHMLYWSDKYEQWVCYKCWSEFHTEVEPRGISLADEIQRQSETLPMTTGQVTAALRKAAEDDEAEINPCCNRCGDRLINGETDTCILCSVIEVEMNKEECK